MKTDNSLKRFLTNFITCGLVGWCMEIIFTAMHSLQKRDMQLKGQTSLWMFPIYGLAACLEPVCRRISGCRTLLRGSIYAGCIFAAEYVSGILLWKKNCCPWDYSRCKWHVGHVIRLDFLPVWFAAGLLFERILGHDHKSGKSNAACHAAQNRGVS